MSIIISALMLAQSAMAFHLPVRVAVVDTGLDLQDERFKSHLCKEGHRDFTGEGLTDRIGHGTHVAGLIKEYAGNTPFCLIIVKYYTVEKRSVVDKFPQALAYAATLKPDFVNVSSAGFGRNDLEELAIGVTPQTRYIVAAGNENVELTEESCHSYPACYDYSNIVVVGNLWTPDKRGIHSNFGPRVGAWEVGTNVFSTLPGGRMGYLSGTSQATAIHTGRLVHAVASY